MEKTVFDFCCFEWRLALRGSVWEWSPSVWEWYFSVWEWSSRVLVGRTEQEIGASTWKNCLYVHIYW